MTIKTEVLLSQILAKQEHSNAQIKELDTKVDIILQERIPALHVDLAMLKVRSGLWGAAAGAIPVIVQAIIQRLS